MSFVNALVIAQFAVVAVVIYGIGHSALGLVREDLRDLMS